MIRNHARFPRRLPRARLVLPLAALTSIASLPAHADVKMIVEVTTTGGPTVAPNQGSDDPVKSTWTVCFHDRKARREEQNGHIVTIYDKDADKVYTIDKAAKTYYVTLYKEARQNGSGYAENDPTGEQMSVDTKVDLDSANSDPDLTRSVAGVPTSKFTLFAEVSGSAKENRAGGSRPSAGGFPGGGGRHGGRGSGSGGGFPGGFGLQGGGSGQRHGGQALPHTSFSGDVWLADAEALLPDAKKDERDLSIALLTEFLPGYSPLLDPLSGQLAKKHRLPLASHLTLRLYNGFSAPVSDGGIENPSGPAIATVPLTIATVVTAIDPHTALDDALFRVPAGFDRVPAPAPVAPLPSPPGAPLRP